MTQKLNQRQIYMLHLIKDNKDIHMDELVRRLDVSRRTIQRDISAIQSYMGNFEIVLDSTGSAVRLFGQDADLKRLFDSFGKMPAAIPLTSKIGQFTHYWNSS